MTSDKRRKLIDYLRVASDPDHHEGVYVLVSVKECRELLAMLDKAVLVSTDYIVQHDDDPFYMDNNVYDAACSLKEVLGDKP